MLMFSFTSHCQAWMLPDLLNTPLKWNLSDKVDQKGSHKGSSHSIQKHLDDPQDIWDNIWTDRTTVGSLEGFMPLNVA